MPHSKGSRCEVQGRREESTVEVRWKTGCGSRQNTCADRCTRQSPGVRFGAPEPGTKGRGPHFWRMKPLLLPVPSDPVPTATTVPLARAVTPASVLEPVEVAFGLAMTLQLLPSQCSVSDR